MRSERSQRVLQEKAKRDEEARIKEDEAKIRQQLNSSRPLGVQRRIALQEELQKLGQKLQQLFTPPSNDQITVG